MSSPRTVSWISRISRNSIGKTSSDEPTYPWSMTSGGAMPDPLKRLPSGAIDSSTARSISRSTSSVLMSERPALQSGVTALPTRCRECRSGPASFANSSRKGAALARTAGELVQVAASRVAPFHLNLVQLPRAHCLSGRRGSATIAARSPWPCACRLNYTRCVRWMRTLPVVIILASGVRSPPRSSTPPTAGAPPRRRTSPSTSTRAATNWPRRAALIAEEAHAQLAPRVGWTPRRKNPADHRRRRRCGRRLGDPVPLQPDPDHADPAAWGVRPRHDASRRLAAPRHHARVHAHSPTRHGFTAPARPALDLRAIVLPECHPAAVADRGAGHLRGDRTDRRGARPISRVGDDPAHGRPRGAVPDPRPDGGPAGRVARRAGPLPLRGVLPALSCRALRPRKNRGAQPVLRGAAPAFPGRVHRPGGSRRGVSRPLERVVGRTSGAVPGPGAHRHGARVDAVDGR